VNPNARAVLEEFDRAQAAVLPRRALEDALARAGALSPETRGGLLAELAGEGLLVTDGDSSAFRRTEAGRLALAGALDLTLYTRPGCHLCEEMKSALAPLLTEFGARMAEVDVDQSEDLKALYGSDVPVLFLGTQKVAKHRLDAAQLRRKLQRARESGAGAPC
jgi:glutaredoxin